MAEQFKCPLARRNVDGIDALVVRKSELTHIAGMLDGISEIAPSPYCEAILDILERLDVMLQLPKEPPKEDER